MSLAGPSSPMSVGPTRLARCTPILPGAVVGGARDGGVNHGLCERGDGRGPPNTQSNQPIVPPVAPAVVVPGSKMWGWALSIMVSPLTGLGETLQQIWPWIPVYRAWPPLSRIMRDRSAAPSCALTPACLPRPQLQASLSIWWTATRQRSRRSPAARHRSICTRARATGRRVRVPPTLGARASLRSMLLRACRHTQKNWPRA